MTDKVLHEDYDIEVKDGVISRGISNSPRVTIADTDKDMPAAHNDKEPREKTRRKSTCEDHIKEFATSAGLEQRQLIDDIKKSAQGQPFNFLLASTKEAVLETFRLWDTKGNNNGYLDQGDFKDNNEALHISKQELWTIFKKRMDINGDDVVDEKEFLQYFVTCALFNTNHGVLSHYGSIGEHLVNIRNVLNSEILELVRDMKNRNFKAFTPDIWKKKLTDDGRTLVNNIIDHKCNLMPHHYTAMMGVIFNELDLDHNGELNIKDFVPDNGYCDIEALKMATESWENMREMFDYDHDKKISHQEFWEYFMYETFLQKPLSSEEIEKECQESKDLGYCLIQWLGHYFRNLHAQINKFIDEYKFRADIKERIMLDAHWKRDLSEGDMDRMIYYTNDERR